MIDSKNRPDSVVVCKIPEFLAGGGHFNRIEAMAAPKEAVVIILDVGSSTTEAGFTASVDAVRLLARQKVGTSYNPQSDDM